MSCLKSPLFWKIVGIYSLFSGIALGGLLLTLNARLQAMDTQLPVEWTTASTTAVLVWLCGVVCAAIVSYLTVSPVQSLLSSLHARSGSAHSKSLLNKLTNRNDEFSEAATLLLLQEETRNDELQRLRNNEVELRAAWSRLNTVLQAMADGVIAIDENERIQFANVAVCRMLEFPDGQVQGRLIYEVIRNAHLHDAVSESLAEKRMTQIEFRLGRKEKRISLAVSPIVSGGAVLAFADVSEIRKLEAMRRDFVSGISHELKTPLTVIQACTETLLDGAVEDPEAADRFLKQIEAQSERLLQLIIGMMQLARLEAGQHVFHQEVVDLREIVGTVVSLMDTVAMTKSISLTITGPSELFVLADSQATRTIVDNLINNALKYTPEHGSVVIELEEEQQFNTLRVVDTGNGIPEEDQQRVFERFYRVERDRNSQSGGTGMGLSIVKHLCHAMGAEVELKSKIGKGTSITVQFPITE